MKSLVRRSYAAGLIVALLPLGIFAQALPARATPAANEAVESGYRLPPAALQAIVDAPRAPQLLLSPKRDTAVLQQVPPLAGIDVVAQPELKLGGLRINPRSYAASRFSFGTDLWLMDVATGAEARIQGLPKPLAVASLAW